MNEPINFARVESLRKHMLLSQADMAELFGVSRVAYHNWVNDRSTPRESNLKRVRKVMKLLLKLYSEGGWPTAQAQATPSAGRLALLVEVIRQR